MISGVLRAYYATIEPKLLQTARLAAPSEASEVPFIDICLPTFNRRDLLLERALPSILAQDYPYFRVFVMVHGSTDGTAEAVSQQYRREPRVKVLMVRRRRFAYPPTAENHWLVGPTDPLNAFLARGAVTSATWFARLDDDDEWTPDHLSRLLAFAEEGDYEFVSSLASVNENLVQPYLYPDGGQASSVWQGNAGLVGGCATWLYRTYLHFFHYNVHAWRKTWNRNNDTDLPERMFKAGVRMGYLNAVTSITRPRPGESQTGSAAYLRDPRATENRFRLDCAR